MNSLNLLFNVSNLILTFTVFILLFLAVKKIYDFAGEVPNMWKRMVTGVFFLTLSEAFSIYKIVFEHSAYFLDFVTQLFSVIGITFLIIGLVPYLGEVTGGYSG